MQAVTHCLQQPGGEGGAASSGAALRGSANVQGQETKGGVILRRGLRFYSGALRVAAAAWQGLGTPSTSIAWAPNRWVLELRR